MCRMRARPRLGSRWGAPVVSFDSSTSALLWALILPLAGVRDPLAASIARARCLDRDQLLAIVPVLCGYDRHHQDGGKAQYRRGYSSAAGVAGWVTFTASWHKFFDPNVRMDFWRHERQLRRARATRLIFNDRLDAAVTGILIVMIAPANFDRVRHRMMQVLSGRKPATVKESPFVNHTLAAQEQA